MLNICLIMIHPDIKHVPLPWSYQLIGFQSVQNDFQQSLLRWIILLYGRRNLESWLSELSALLHQVDRSVRYEYLINQLRNFFFYLNWFQSSVCLSTCISSRGTAGTWIQSWGFLPYVLLHCHVREDPIVSSALLHFKSQYVRVRENWLDFLISLTNAIIFRQ